MERQTGPNHEMMAVLAILAMEFIFYPIYKENPG